MREVSIKCTGADYLDIDDLKPFQGDLKSLSKENFNKLKAVILKHGFSEPASVWRNGGKYYLCNGHQRHRVLQGMRSEGYFVPKIPVNWIEAKDKKEAKEKVLALTSQYGQLTDESLSQFMIDSEIEFSFLEEHIRFPEVDLARDFDANFDPGTEDDQGQLDEKKKVECPECGAEFHPK